MYVQEWKGEGGGRRGQRVSVTLVVLFYLQGNAGIKSSEPELKIQKGEKFPGLYIS